MRYSVKLPILGFESVTEVEFKKIDDLFATINAVNEDSINFTLANPNKLREYSFDMPAEAQAQLGINDSSNLMVYNIVIIHNPVGESEIDFISPIIFNTDNHTVAQISLSPIENPEYVEIRKIKSFAK